MNKNNGRVGNNALQSFFCQIALVVSWLMLAKRKREFRARGLGIGLGSQATQDSHFFFFIIILL